MSAGYIADRAKLKGQTRDKSYYKGDPGEAATLEITGADALNPNENPSVVEETGSTSQNRKYRLGIPGGKSAYDIAVKNGFKGTEQEWLDSLHGSGGGGGDITADAIEKALGYLPADPSDIDPAGTARSLVGEHNKDIEAHNDIRLLLLNLENEIPETTSRLENDSGYITKAVTDLVNYYTKSQTYTKDEINNLVSAVPKFSIQVVSSLPTTNISSTTVYLLKSGDEQSNLYTEYIYVNGAWEYLGKQTVDLSGYALKTDIPTKLSALTDDVGYITQNALNTALAGYAKKATTLAEYGITDGATKAQFEQLNKEKVDLNWGSSNVGKILVVGTNGNLVLADMPEASGDVNGVLDENMNILLSGNIAVGTYTLAFVNEDGTCTGTGSLVVSEVEPEPDAPSYTNILTSGTYTVELNKRWSGSAKAYQTCNGMIGLIIPAADVRNKTIRFKGFTKDLMASAQKALWMYLDSSKTRLNILADSSGTGLIWGSIQLVDEGNGVYSLLCNSSAWNGTFDDAVYVAINMAVNESAAVTSLDGLIMTIDEEIV